MSLFPKADNSITSTFPGMKIISGGEDKLRWSRSLERSEGQADQETLGTVGSHDLMKCREKSEQS